MLENWPHSDVDLDPFVWRLPVCKLGVSGLVVGLRMRHHVTGCVLLLRQVLLVWRIATRCLSHVPF